jgi:hypothetical protein
LPVWERQPTSAEAPSPGNSGPGAAGRPNFAVARVGPATLAVGAPGEVDELVLVRLGMKPDLKITGQLFDRFQALDRDSALRIISRDPPDLSRVFHPIFTPELLNASQLLGLAVNLQSEFDEKRRRSRPKFAGQSAAMAAFARLAFVALLAGAGSPKTRHIEHGIALRGPRR